MKLSKLVPEMEKRFSRITNLKEYADALKSSGEYRVYETRLAWDCLRCAFKTSEICTWYDEYECHDTHITSAAKAALRNLSIL